MNIKHNKIKNTGILFELLVRKISADVLEGKTDSFATKVLREHFHSKSELGKELQLYRSFFGRKDLSENKAFNMLDLILERRKKLNEKILNTQKYNLIKELKEHCDVKDFMTGRVPSYKVYASIYKLFETTIKEDVDYEIDEVVSSRFVVVEHLKGELKEEAIIKESQYVSAVKDQPEELRHLSYKILLEKFNDKYSIFSQQQKTLLKEYINNGTDLKKFSAFASKEAKVIREEITKNSYKVDEVTKIKIKEVISQLENIERKSILKENHITALLIGYQLAQELTTLKQR